MDDHFNEWLKDRIQNNRSGPPRVQLTGVCAPPNGPMHQFASVSISVEESEKFEVVDVTNSNQEIRAVMNLDYFIFGILDVLLPYDMLAINKLKIILEKVECNLIDVSPMAFRFAGRNAGKQIAEACSREFPKPKFPSSSAFKGLP